MEDVKKEGGKKITFNLSPSSLNVYYQSPLLFYLKYIAKVPDDTPVPVCYGLSGSIVHNCLEKYAKEEFDKDGAYMHLAEQWLKFKLDYHKDIKNNLLKQEDYLNALAYGLGIVDKYENHVCEETISFPFLESDEIKIGVKGIIDLQANQKLNSEFVIIDYKTSNSINQGLDFQRQALFYNYLIKKKKGLLPSKTTFHYLKLKTPKSYSFSQEDIELFEDQIRAVGNQIIEYGDDIGNYPIGEINDLFNSKKQACLKEVVRRQGFSDAKKFVEMHF